MDDDWLSISTDMWKVLSQTIEQVWMAVNDSKRIKAILIGMRLSFIDNDNISLREVSQTWKEYNKVIIWETSQQNKTMLSFELIPNSIEHSTLLHTVITHHFYNKNSSEEYTNELNSKCKEINELLPGILFGPSNSIVSYESIQINCDFKDLYDFISSWEFIKVPHSLIKQVKCIQGQFNILNGVIQCICKNDSIHYYQVAEIDFNPNQMTARYNIKEIEDKNNENGGNVMIKTIPSNIHIDSHRIHFTFGHTDAIHSFLSVEHQFTYKKIDLLLYQRSISNLIKDKKCMLIEIKKYLESKPNRKKSISSNKSKG